MVVRRAQARVAMPGLVAALVACSPSSPVPREPPFERVAPGLEFGMLGADLLEARPGVYPTEEGTFEETHDVWELAYHMRPWEEGEPPDLLTRLIGVEHRIEYRDSMSMWRNWHTQVERYAAASGRKPVCATLSTLRYAGTRALIEGPTEWRAVGIVIRGDDGRSYEAHLHSRVSQGPLDGLTGLGEAGVWNPVDCPASEAPAP